MEDELAAMEKGDDAPKPAPKPKPAPPKDDYEAKLKKMQDAMDELKREHEAGGSGSTGSSGSTSGGSSSSTTSSGTPKKGCVDDGKGNLTCNWAQMATPICPKPGKNVAMPTNCRPPKPTMLVLLL